MPDLALRSPAGRGVLAAAVLGSGMAFLDSTVVNVALRTLGTDLDASLAQLQWATNGYLVSLAALILLGGSLGDRYGRRRIFVIGTIWFTAASLLCGLAPTPTLLVAARVLQGVGGALLTPGSLSILQSTFGPADRPAAIGAWSGLSGIAGAAGPLVGGLLVDLASWRWIFLVNVPLGVATVWCALRFVPESRDDDETGRFDVPGAVLAALALAGVTYALIDWGSALGWGLGAAGVAAAVAFLLVERRTREPMVPLGLFRDPTFSAANGMTLLVYAALGAVTFFVTLQLQTVSGYDPLWAGLAGLPGTVLMLLFASWGGRLATRIGPRVPMTAGPLLIAGGVLLLLRIGPSTSYALDVLPGMTVFGLGLVLLVAPLTATVLAAAPDRHAGVASGINNAVARSGTLLAIAALPALVGLAGADYDVAAAFDPAFRRAMGICAALLALGAVVSWVSIPRRVLESPTGDPDPAPHQPGRP